MKTNVGHLEAASGMAGLIKALLALRYAQLPPTLHFDQPNRHLRLEQSAFYVNDRLRRWPQPAGGQPRRAAVSALGFGGTNVHLLLTQPPTTPNTPAQAQTSPFHLLALSAESPAALAELVASYRDYLNSDTSTALADLCFTAGGGRSAGRWRLVLVVGAGRISWPTSCGYCRIGKSEIGCGAR